MKNVNKITRLFFLYSSLLLLLYGCMSTNGKAQTKKPLIVFVTGDHEYSGEATLPLIAAELEKNYGFRTILLKASPDQNAEENIREEHQFLRRRDNDTLRSYRCAARRRSGECGRPAPVNWNQSQDR